jgi:GNAT superfamily N-acetyltransferase
MREDAPVHTKQRNLVIEPFTIDSPNVEDAIWVFTDTWNGNRDDAYAFFARQAKLPDFVGRLVVLDGWSVAMGFGTASEPGQWWHDRVAEQLGAAHAALQDAWVVTEMAVIEDHRGKGIAGRLLGDLLASQPHPRALLSTQVHNYSARRLYEKHGWRYLHDGFVFEPGHVPYVVMARELNDSVLRTGTSSPR